MEKPEFSLIDVLPERFNDGTKNAWKENRNAQKCGNLTVRSLEYNDSFAYVFLDSNKWLASCVVFHGAMTHYNIRLRDGVSISEIASKIQLKSPIKTKILEFITEEKIFSSCVLTAVEMGLLSFLTSPQIAGLASPTALLLTSMYMFKRLNSSAINMELAISEILKEAKEQHMKEMRLATVGRCL